MLTRPTEVWRSQVAEEIEAVAAGSLEADEAYAAECWPEELIADTDAVLADFERALATLDVGRDEDVFDVIKTVVLALNKVDAENPDPGYETGEREQLCSYIDAS